MSEDLQSLLEKINREGVEKARAEADKIIADAKAKAADIVKTANAEATKAKADAEKAAADYAARAAEIQQLHAEIEQFKQQIADLKEEMEKRQTPHAREWSTDVIEPEIVADEMPPPVARQAFDFGNAAALADLERRAQQELARMGATGAKQLFRMKK